ncbi:MAG TPA: CoA pyrophosphatase [Terrimesophilobacter sp.]|nr:CoA pyrophosphatase [Terrimesophilobacter sp.]
MSLTMSDARAELDALCLHGLDWAVDPSRFLADPSSARRSAVLVLFGVLDSAPAHADGPVGRDLDVLLQRRATTLGHHAGQISFPGGGVEASDHDITATALREAVEETGLEPSGVEVLGILPDFPVPVSNNLVTPVIAWWTHASRVAAVDQHESVEVFRVPVSDLLEPANRATVNHVVSGRSFRTPAFTVHGVVVWGFTAIVLSRLFDELGWVVPWDHDRIVRP